MKLEELARTVAEYLAPRLPGAVVTTEYPAARRPHPLRQPMVGVGLDGVRCRKDGFSPYLGVDADGVQQFGQMARITLRLDILCPGETGGCHELFASLCGLLLLEDGPVVPDNLWCENLEYDRMSDGLRLCARADLEAVLLQSGQDGAIREIEIVRRDG